MGKARLGPWRFSVDPNAIRWGIKANLSDKKGLGGKVVQVLSVHYTALTVETVFTTWEEQADFLATMKATIREDLARDTPRHMRFTYPPRGIDFTVAVMSLSQTGQRRTIRLGVDDLPRPITLNLTIIGSASNVLTRADYSTVDEYINRFTEEFGWKRTVYNGPISPEDVTAYAVGINQRQPPTGADAVIRNYADRGMSTPTPGAGRATPSNAN